MKLQTNNLRRLCLLVSLILLFAVLLPACSASSEPLTEVTDDLLVRIENDFAKYMYECGTNPAFEGPWPIEYCYGIYNGCVPVMFSTGSYSMGWSDEIADSIIYYRDSKFIFVWNNGNFLRIEEAYERGLLTQGNISEIADIHNNIRYTDFDDN